MLKIKLILLAVAGAVVSAVTAIIASKSAGMFAKAHYENKIEELKEHERQKAQIKNKIGNGDAATRFDTCNDIVQKLSKRK